MVGNFDDIIAQFSKKYTAYVVYDWHNRDDGGRDNLYKKVTIHGSLQSDGRKKLLRADGSSSIENSYILYANKRYILNEGDYIKDSNGNILIVDSLKPWEEEGSYREYSLIRTTTTERRILDQFKGDVNLDADLPNPDLERVLREKTLK